MTKTCLNEARRANVRLRSRNRELEGLVNELGEQKQALEALIKGASEPQEAITWNIRLMSRRSITNHVDGPLTLREARNIKCLPWTQPSILSTRVIQSLAQRLKP